MDTQSTNSGDRFIHTEYGYCYYCVDCDGAWVWGLYIEKDMRKRGCARRILSIIANEIKSISPTVPIYIEPEPEENSIGLTDLISFYEEFGFICRKAAS